MLKTFINLLTVLFIAVSMSACATTGAGVNSPPVLITNESPGFSIMAPSSWSQGKKGKDYLTLSTNGILAIRIFESPDMTEDTSPEQSAESIVNFLKKEFKGKGFQIENSNKINIADGTNANESKMSWTEPKHSMTCYSYGISAKKGGTKLSVVATDIYPINEKTQKIVKSLNIN